MNIDWITEYAPYISRLGTFFKIMKGASVYLKKIRDEIKDFESENELNIDEIYPYLSKGKINIGDTIYTSGYLLQYGQVFMPYTYTTYVYSAASTEEMEDFNKKHKGTEHELREKELLFKKNEFILPAKKMNFVDNIGCAFIYDDKFNGLYRREDNENRKYAKPMLVLYDVKKHLNYINKKIELKGRLCSVPTDIAERLNITSNSWINDICGNFYQPFCESNNLICISLLDDDAKIVDKHKTIKENIPDMEIPIFVEAKIEGILEEKDPLKIIRGFLPNTYDKYSNGLWNAPMFRTNKYEAITIPSSDNIIVSYRNGNIGFYTSTSLTDAEKYASDLEKYTRYINNFAVDYKNFCQKELGRKELMEIVFITDDTKRNLFLGRNSSCIFEDDKYDKFPEISWIKGKT